MRINYLKISKVCVSENLRFVCDLDNQTYMTTVNNEHKHI